VPTPQLLDRRPEQADGTVFMWADCRLQHLVPVRAIPWQGFSTNSIAAVVTVDNQTYADPPKPIHPEV